MLLSTSDDAANEQGGWGTYEYAVVAGATSYGTYCFGVWLGSASHCSDFAVRIGVASDGSALGAAFSAVISDGNGGPYMYSWKFGDGSTSSASGPEHNYSKAGAYAVTVAVSEGSQFPTASADVTVSVQGTSGWSGPNYPRLSTALVNANSTYLLADSVDGPSGAGYLLLSDGSYSPSAAVSILSSSNAAGLPLAWSSPDLVAGFPRPISGDAVAASVNGQTIAVAASSNNSTWVFESTNGGSSWIALTPQGLPGSDPDLALGGSSLLVATWLPTTSPAEAVASTLSLAGYGTAQVDLEFDGSPTVSYAPTVALGAGSAAPGLAIATAGGNIVYYRSTNNGFNYVATLIGSYENSTSTIFREIGDTSLFDSDAIAGAVTAVAEGANVFVMYTTTVGGRTQANVTTSPNAGTQWNPTMAYRLPDGSLGEPEAATSATGYVYVTWTDDSQGATGVDQAVFDSDGRIIQNATELPGTGGSAAAPAASAPTVTVDAWMRPLYVWTGGAGSTASSLEASGAFLSPKNAQALVNSSFRQLTSWDFSPTSPGKTTSNQTANTASFNSASSKLATAIATDPPGPCFPSADQNASASMYGTLTRVPLVPFVTPSSKCANLAPAEKPTSNVTEQGATASGTVDSVLMDWVLEGLGVDVTYSGDALATALNDGPSADPTTSTLPPVPGPKTTYAASTEIYGQTATDQVKVSPLNPTTGWLGLSSSFPTPIQLNNQSTACTGGTIYSDNYTESVQFSVSVTVDGMSGTLTGSAPGGSPSFDTATYLTNLTPNAGNPWSTGSVAVTYDRFWHLSSSCKNVAWTINEGTYATQYVPGLSGTLYTNLSMVPEAPGGTYVEVTPSTETPPFIDGSSAAGLDNGDPGTVSATLSTTYQYDTVIAFVTVATLSGQAPTVACSDASHNTWKTRTSVTGVSGEYPGVFEVYANVTTVLSGDEISCAADSGTNNLAMVVYAVHEGAAFDDSGSLPATAILDVGSDGNFALKAVTNSSRDLILGMLGCFSTNSVSPSPGFQAISSISYPPTAYVEKNTTNVAGTHYVNWTDPCAGNGMVLIADAVTGGYGNITLAWSNTMPAQASASYSNSIGWDGSATSSPWLINETFGWSTLPAGPPQGSGEDNYAVSMNAESQPGVWNSSQLPAVSAGDDFDANPLTTSYSCSFPLQPDSVAIQGAPQVTVSPTANKATVTWNSNVEGPSWLQYSELGVGLNWTQTALMNKTSNSKFPYQYSVELQGIPAFALFGLTAWSSFVAVPGCVSYANSSSSVFLTPGALPLTESDLPYDSITNVGGGASIGWTVSPGFVSNGQLLNGTLYYNVTGSATTTIAPIESSAAVAQSVATYAYNLSLPQLNTSYTAWLELNYSISWQSIHVDTPVFSLPITFVYQRDTTGDGLTNLEKVLGWAVPVTSLSGTTTGRMVTANPQAFATNGLVSDYVEKEYDLNPNTVDTAGSHMLDTWSLTFDLGLAANSPELPTTSIFEYWYENASYNPFSTSGPTSQNQTSNIAANPTGGQSSGDGSSASSSILWSLSALYTFENLTGVKAAGWLRAVTGTWKGVRTLTVEGKLSWGANPLDASTPGDAVADGQRVDPATTVGLSATISNLYVHGLSTGQGYAVMFRSYSGSATTGTPEFTNYSAPVGLGLGAGNGTTGKIARLTGYRVILPVKQTSQFQTLQLEILANESNTSTLTPIAFDSGSKEVNLTYDMVEGAWLNETFGSTSSSPNGSLSIQFKEVAVGGKDPTYLWLPSDNGTINGLPPGLDRYTGEQSFDLVVVDASTSLASDAMPQPWGGFGPAITLEPGLNNLLIPRDQFLDSPFGEAILLGRNTSYPSSAAAPPLVGSSEQSLVKPMGGANLMVDLGAYWQNRSIATGPGNITGARERGTPNGTSLSVQAMAAESTASNNIGGLASNPDVYSSTGDPPALQGIFTLNITNTSTLDLLVAGLIDNTTGGVNGTFQNVTSQVASLGLDGPVVNALANVTLVGGGLYGPPTHTSPPSSKGNLWSDFWNAAAAVITNPLGAVLSLIELTLSLAEAASLYLDQLAHEASAISAKVLSRAAGAFVAAGKAVVQGLQELLSLIWSLIKETVSAVVQPLSAAFSSALKAWAAGLFAATNWTLLAYNGTQNAESSAAARLGSALAVPLLIGTSIGTVVDIVLGIAAPLDIGAGTLVGFLAPLIIELFETTLSYASQSGWSGLLNSQLSASALTSFNGFGSLAQWLFNQTHSISSITAGAWIDPPGDSWSFVVGISGAGAFVFGLVAAFLLSDSEGSGADSTLTAATAMVFSVCSLISALAESLISVLFSSYVAHVAEFELAVLATTFGVLAIGSAAFGIGKGPGFNLATLAGGMGLVLGGIGLWAGYEDLSYLYSES